MTLDEIYESFIWDASYTNEEYESKISIGINEAKNYKYLYPFIQPVIPEKTKNTSKVPRYKHCCPAEKSRKSEGIWRAKYESAADRLKDGVDLYDKKTVL
ncbi:MAG: hypothetical protein IJW86_05925 [Clostridia bacterium]|nr:hypothetical protein [Clostridia bacterium]